MRLLFVLILSLMVLVSSDAHAEGASAGEVTVVLPERSKLPSSPGFFVVPVTVQAVGEQFPMNFCLFLPPAYFAQKEPFPVVVALHNRGVEGTNGYAVTAEGLAAMWVRDDWDPREKAVQAAGNALTLRKSARFIGIAPQAPKGRPMQVVPIPQAISKCIDALGAVYRIDQERVYLTGFSWGGSNTWLVAEQTPDRYAAIVPLSFKATPEPAKTVEALLHVPVYMACGTADAYFAQFAQQMNQAMTDGHHPDFVLRLIPNGSHFAYGAVYTDPAFWDWLFSKRRQPRAATRPAVLSTTQPS